MRRRGDIRFQAIVAAAGLLAAALAATPAVSQTAATAPQVKAAYLMKFGAFADWPATSNLGATGPLVLCVVGRGPVAVALDGLATPGAAVGSHPIVLRRLQRVGADSGCHIAFVGGSKEQPAADGLKALGSAPVLTVTDAELGPAHGVIHFIVQQNRVRFTIDAGAAGRSGLNLSSKLLALALAVEP